MKSIDNQDHQKKFHWIHNMNNQLYLNIRTIINTSDALRIRGEFAILLNSGELDNLLKLKLWGSKI